MDYRSAGKYGRVSLFTPSEFSTCKFNCDLLSEHCQYYLSLLLWQPLITKTNDHPNGKSLSWISSGEFTRELDKESLLN